MQNYDPPLWCGNKDCYQRPTPVADMQQGEQYDVVMPGWDAPKRLTVERVVVHKDDAMVWFAELPPPNWFPAYLVWAVKVGQFKVYCHGF